VLRNLDRTLHEAREQTSMLEKHATALKSAVLTNAGPPELETKKTIRSPALELLGAAEWKDVVDVKGELLKRLARNANKQVCPLHSTARGQQLILARRKVCPVWSRKKVACVSSWRPWGGGLPTQSLLCSTRQQTLSCLWLPKGTVIWIWSIEGLASALLREEEFRFNVDTDCTISRPTFQFNTVVL